VAEDDDDSTSPLRTTEVERPFPSSDSPMVPLRSGMVLGGRYEIGKTIGQGGMGVVVQAFDRTLAVEVAIKIVRAEYAAEREWSERLAREVKLARQIQHPNVCRVFEYAQADGRAFLIMELAMGGTLRDELRTGTTATRPLAARIADARAIAAGLGAIHAAGIVHRDISPHNALRMSDGRLVLSDFGLATDSSDGTTSIRGGTAAYMAPEVVRGGRASFSADIWGLGAVIHETVFGQPLRWDPESGEMRSSVAGLRLTRTERSVLEICRACLTLNPARRPRDAAEIAARLSEAGLVQSVGRRWRRQAATAAAAAFVIVAAVVGGQRVKTSRKRAAATATAAAAVDPLMIVPIGEPDDWTDTSKVLAEVPGRIRCLVPLPDHHTVRFVWGDPPHAEDIDTRTGEQTASPLVPDAYAEGCPDLSRDGGRVVYAGHTPDDRAYAFVSTHPDGRDGVPEVPIAEPTMSSDPVWLPDGKMFTYDIDSSHVGVFSLATKRSEVVPAAEAPVFTIYHAVVGDRVLITSILETEDETDLAEFSLPGLQRMIHFHLPTPALDVMSPGRDEYYCSVMRGDRWVILKIEPLLDRGRFVGEVRGQSLRTPVFVEHGTAFLSIASKGNMILRRGKTEDRVPVGNDIGWASRCGDRIIATESKSGKVRTVWLDPKGRIVDSFPDGDGTVTPTCSSDGRLTFLATLGPKPEVRRCDRAGCRRIFEGNSGWLTLSSDDRRLAFLSSDNRGHVVRWIAADGSGGGREIAEVDIGCAPAWENDRDLWIALRKGRKLIWTEFNTDSAVPTGRTSPGTSDCIFGVVDPASPIKAPSRVEVTFRTQLRFLPEKYLPAQYGNR
jgi:hypothetical protein